MDTNDSPLSASPDKRAKGNSRSKNSKKALTFLCRYTAKWEDQGWFVQVVAIKPAQAEGDKPPIEAVSVEPEQIWSLQSWIEDHMGVWNLYFAVNPLKHRLTSKAKKEDIAALAYLHIDLDPKKGEPLEAERTRLRADVNAFSVIPTFLIDSGNGLGVFWRLDEPIPLDGNVEELEDTNKRLAQHFGADSCYNIDRIMRLPDTVNLPDWRKKAKGRVRVPAKLLYYCREASYSLEDFDFLPPVPETVTTGKPPAEIHLEPVNETALATRLQMVQIDPELTKLRQGEALPWMTDTSSSGFDFALGLRLTLLGFKDGEIAHCLLAYPHGKAAGRKDVDKYITNILRKIREHIGKSGATEPGIPTGKCLTTDQANASRLLKAAGSNLMFAAGQWHIWTGTHWSADKAAAYRQTCNLSALILAEAREWEQMPFKTADEEERNRQFAKQLRAWAHQSEMKPRLDAAFSLLQMMVEMPADQLDSDPYLLNVLNGTVDLRTSKLRSHDKADLLTKIIPINYDPAAKALLFERTVAEITGEAGHLHKPVAEFLQRWFGYCATGLTSEQMFAVHHGHGANGKSLLLGTVERVLGPYAGVAAPGLLVGNAQDRHPTELADLRGKRLVTCYESTEDGVLREETVKRATGSDRIKARYMRQDFFEFSPTHTIQLVTNHKPQIRGQDHAIWRRVLLISYHVIFGAPAAVKAKEAHFVKDEALAERLKTEDAGILAWLVKGAMYWHLSGLNPPDSVLAAGVSYREEQDRVGQFLNECCERKEGSRVPLSILHTAYKNWMQGCQYYPMGRNKFAEAVEKRPGIGVDDNGRGKVFTGITIARPF